MKKKITFILEKLGGAALEVGVLFLAFLNAGHGASYSKLEYERRKIEKGIGDLLEEQTKARYSKLIYKFKKEGLIKEEYRNKRKFLIITVKGKKKLASLLDKESKSLPQAVYPKEKINYSIIVIFDIPEQKRNKRNWLRQALREINFEMVQKSVWIGKTKIPKDFLVDLDELGISQYVEIFAVSKSGSLGKLKSGSLGKLD